MAILDADNLDEAQRYHVIPFHQVPKRLKDLRVLNNGRHPLIIRKGHLINVAHGRFEGRWRVHSIKNKVKGIYFDIGHPDVVRLQSGTNGHKLDVLLSSLDSGSLSVMPRSLIGD